MNRSLARCQVVAFGAGILLCVIGLAGMFTLHFGRGDLVDAAAIVIQLLLALVVPAIVTSCVAVYSHPYWKVVLLTTLVPVLFIFLAGYAMDIRDQIESSARHEMTGGMLGYTPPLHLPGQAAKAAPLLLWAALVSALALLIKRLLVHENEEDRNEREDDRFFTPFVWGLLALVVSGVIGFSIVTGLQNTPSARVAWAAKILQSPKSTDSERSRALFDIWHLRNDDAGKILRAAANEQPPPLNVLAASFLADRNDISALPLLETQLMQSGTLKAKYFTWNIALSLGRIKDPEAVPTLIRLLKADDHETRQGAAQALRSIGGDAVIDPLVAGLSDPDWKVRWISVMGLTEVAETRPTELSSFPDSDQFKSNEKLYLDYWKEWAARRAGR